MSKPPTHLVIFGRPGSGKSTLAERLGLEHGYQLVRTGELLRAAIRRDDHLGRRVEVHLARGELVPDPLIFELLEASLRAPVTSRLLFDGFPRTMGQVPLLEQFERKLGFRVECFLDIQVGRAEAISRMSDRRVCPSCGATYHLTARPPRQDEVCDLDGTPLERRKDDAIEVVKNRQDLYDQHADPILQHYRSVAADQFVAVNGEQPADAVYAETLRALGFVK